MKKHTSLTATIIIIAVFVLLIVGAVVIVKVFYKPTNPNIVEYNNYVFERSDDGKWYFEMLLRNQTYIFGFHYNPAELENISFEGPVIASKMRTFRSLNPQGNIYITVDPYASAKHVIASVELAKILGTAYNIYNFNVSAAITKPVEGVQYPVLDCRNESSSKMIIWMTLGDENKISSSQNCIIVQALNDDDLIRTADAFAYRLLGIMDTRNNIADYQEW